MDTNKSTTVVTNIKISPRTNSESSVIIQPGVAAAFVKALYTWFKIKGHSKLTEVSLVSYKLVLKPIFINIRYRKLYSAPEYKLHPLILKRKSILYMYRPHRIISRGCPHCNMRYLHRKMSLVWIFKLLIKCIW